MRCSWRVDVAVFFLEKSISETTRSEKQAFVFVGDIVLRNINYRIIYLFVTFCKQKLPQDVFFNLQKDSNEIRTPNQAWSGDKDCRWVFWYRQVHLFLTKKQLIVFFNLVFTQQVPKCSKDFWDPRIWSLLAGWSRMRSHFSWMNFLAFCI